MIEVADFWCREGDLNPHDRLRSADFKSAVSADSTIPALVWTAGRQAHQRIFRRACEAGKERFILV
jgi:hypothetical protein